MMSKHFDLVGELPDYPVAVVTCRHTLPRTGVSRFSNRLDRTRGTSVHHLFVASRWLKIDSMSGLTERYSLRNRILLETPIFPVCSVCGRKCWDDSSDTSLEGIYPEQIREPPYAQDAMTDRFVSKEILVKLLRLTQVYQDSQLFHKFLWSG